jgi:hypothetical protein
VHGRATFVALTSVTNGVRECDCAGWDEAPAGGPGMIARDFAFCGVSAANELSEFREHGPGPHHRGEVMQEDDGGQRTAGDVRRGTRYF